MIEKLKRKDVEEAARVYNKGLQMEIPSGYSTLNESINHLKKLNTFVYKERNKIRGLISFTSKNKDKIKIDFICAIKPRKGIGKKLINELADFSLKNNIQWIYTAMSSKDKRAMSFYKNCGFKKNGKYSSYQNLTLYRIRAKPEWIKKE